MKILLTTLSAFVLALSLSLPATAATAAEEAALAAVMEELQDVITQLSYEDNLSRKQTDDLRRQLAGLYRDLENIRGDGVVAGYPDYDDNDGRADVWTRFGSATLRLNPSTARFSGWKTGNTIRTSYGNGGLIYITIANVAYTARWTLTNAYSGTVNTTVKAESTGDVRLNVTDGNGTHYFLIKDGGLGPIYARGLGNSGSAQGGGSYPRNPPGGGNYSATGVWHKNYRSDVTNRVLRESFPMTWLIQQYQDNSFVNSKVRNFGVVLGDLEGTPLSYSPIGKLLYQQGGRTYELDIPDPRRTPAEFAGVAKVLYDLHEAGSYYDFELPNLD
jgi:hypothetical protein